MPVDRSKPAHKVAAHQRSGRGVIRVPYPIRIRKLTVLRRTWITARMLRLTLGGPGLGGFHSYVADDHVKLVFPDPDGRLRLPVPNDHDMLDWPQPLPPTRCYTVRSYDPTAGELDLDVVVHGSGLASTWAANATIGETVAVAGPPGGHAFPATYEHMIFAVDTTAIPAAARWLAERGRADVEADLGPSSGPRPSVTGPRRIDLFAVAEDRSQRDYPLDHPRLDLRWLDGSTGPVEISAELATAVDRAAGASPAAAEQTFLFAAGEADLIKPLRRWARSREIDHSITGYWKRGVSDFDD